jgi:membrane associated rhomboid family serine protease
MNGYDTQEEQQPITWFRGQPVYATHFIVLGFVVSMLATSILMFAKATTLLGWLAFDSVAVLRGELWRVLSYGLINPPSLWFAVNMLMLVWFGRELEKFFGRTRFLWLFGSLYLLKPVLFTLIGLWTPTDFYGQSGGFALFVAFATLYPNAVMLFNLLAKWVAIILVGLYALMALSSRDWISLVSLLASVGFAHAYVRYQQGILTFPTLRLPRRQPRLHVVPDADEPAHRPAPKNISAGSAKPIISTSEMDALLDKIARSGMKSLTADERERLTAAAKAHTERKSGR